MIGSREKQTFYFLKLPFNIDDLYLKDSRYHTMRSYFKVSLWLNLLVIAGKGTSIPHEERASIVSGAEKPFSGLSWSCRMKHCYTYQYYLSLKAEFVTTPQAHGVCDP